MGSRLTNIAEEFRRATPARYAVLMTYRCRVVSSHWRRRSLRQYWEGAGALVRAMMRANLRVRVGFGAIGSEV